MLIDPDGRVPRLLRPIAPRQLQRTLCRGVVRGQGAVREPSKGAEDEELRAHPRAARLSNRRPGRRLLRAVRHRRLMPTWSFHASSATPVRSLIMMRGNWSVPSHPGHPSDVGPAGAERRWLCRGSQQKKALGRGQLSIAIAA